MLSQGQELAALDFTHIIGGPLQAVIKAQAASAMVTYDFIQRAAFEGGSTGGNGSATQLRVVEFDFGQLLGDTQGPSEAHGTTKALSIIKVPLLTMLPIPFIRVDTMSIDLNVQLHDIKTSSLSNSIIASAGTTSSENLEVESSTMTTSVTEQNTFQQGQTVDDTYSLKVSVHAVQDQMPGGMANILSIFSNTVQTQSVLIQQMMTNAVNQQIKQLNAQSTPVAPPAITASPAPATNAEG
jgi:hypothetical protein